jgi:polysaccharide biosynthesis PFTS motif protein
MQIPIISSYLRKKHSRNLRSVMRGYRILKQQNKTDFILQLKHQISNTHLNLEHKDLSKKIFGAGISKAELIIRQFLMVKIIGLKFNVVVLAAISNPIKKIAYPLPTRWIKILQQNGIKVSERKSFMLFNFLCLRMVFIGIAYGFFLSIYSLLKLRVVKVSNKKNGIVYFNSLVASNIPNNAHGHNIINWYLQYKNRLKNLDFIFHSVKSTNNISLNNVNIKYYGKTIVLFSSVKIIICYLGWIFSSAFIAFFSILRGKWWNAIVFYEASKSSAIKFQNSQYLANQYLFHNSEPLYRPLWTYEAELKGSEIIFYFYSTNIESFVQKGKKFIQANNFHLINWPKYLVWNKYQAHFISRMDINMPIVEIVGCIWFQSSKSDVDHIPKKSIAVFDVQPFRDSRYQILGEDFNYYLPETANSFVNDIYKVSAKNEFTMVFKKKRDIGKMAHPSYILNIEKLKNQSYFLFMDSNLAALEIIQNCFAVVSMPFTSTALIAKELGKPTVYYDPLSLLQKDDPAAHGIEIINSRIQLNDWLRDLNFQG